jgi:Ricin-type beta-trefoil lectin domain-like
MTPTNRTRRSRFASAVLTLCSLAIGLVVFVPVGPADAVGYGAMNCSNGYWANLSAAQYLDLYNSSTDYGYCAPAGLFNARNGYSPVFATETNVTNDYGKTPVYQNGNCSPPALPTGPSWDFLLPCQAHDYCYDLRKAGFSGTVSDGGCDNAFYWLMEAHCNDRVLAGTCRTIRDTYYLAVAAPGVVTDPDPAAVSIKALHSSKCADVTGSSFASGAAILQYSCTGTPNQKFKIAPAPNAPGYFLMQPTHSGKCADVDQVTNGLTQYFCGAFQEQRFTIQGSFLQNNFTLRSQLHGGTWCWDVPGSSTATVQLTEYSCFETSNQRWILA